ncbi:hypothetical protein FB45DRAFT_352267 [Roridomyces roridus]|uniref:DUF6534 domain-containing protein n=1 Tax=Roridomyces roridus TaxID=1738132 RepID=A0AAD7FVV7_9AGAR|nr:hypothetical protein FB45DRAFT_352267 [Roridomyces roridus]
MAMAALLFPRADSPPPAGEGAPSFQLTFSPLFFGVILNVMLFGVFLVQVYTYFRLYKTDHPAIRYTIYYLIIMEVINTIFDVGLIYQPLVLLRDSPNALQQSPFFLSADAVVTALISTPTQLFFAWRIRRITKSRWLAGIVGFLALVSLAAATAATIGVARVHEFAKFGLLIPQLTVWLTTTAVADILITTFLVNFLWKNQTGFDTQTDSVTDKIILFTVQTGMITSFAAIADVSVFLIIQQTTLQFIWDFSLGKLYSISLISTLIARKEWNNLLDEMPVPAAGDAEMNLGKAKGLHAKDAIIRIRRATDIQGLQLYIPENFAEAEVDANKDKGLDLEPITSSTTSRRPSRGLELQIPQGVPSPKDPSSMSAGSPIAARRRTPRVERPPRPLPVPVPPGLGVDPRGERARRTAAWAMSTGR